MTVVKGICCNAANIDFGAIRECEFGAIARNLGAINQHALTIRKRRVHKVKMETMLAP
jgi:hypothetical protein